MKQTLAILPLILILFAFDKSKTITQEISSFNSSNNLNESDISFYNVLPKKDLLAENKHTNIPDEVSLIPVDSYVLEYKNYNKLIVEKVSRMDTLSATEQRQKIKEELALLKQEFVDSRWKDYERVAILIKGELHTCESGSSGGVKECGEKCVTIPYGMHTKSAWVTVEGVNKGITFSDKKVCLNMTVAGKGSNSGRLKVICKYKSDYIKKSVEKDQIWLFNQL